MPSLSSGRSTSLPLYELYVRCKPPLVFILLFEVVPFRVRSHPKLSIPLAGARKVHRAVTGRAGGLHGGILPRVHRGAGRAGSTAKYFPHAGTIEMTRFRIGP